MLFYHSHLAWHVSLPSNLAGLTQGECHSCIQLNTNCHRRRQPTTVWKVNDQFRDRFCFLVHSLTDFSILAISKTHACFLSLMLQTLSIVLRKQLLSESHNVSQSIASCVVSSLFRRAFRSLFELAELDWFARGLTIEIN